MLTKCNTCTKYATCKDKDEYLYCTKYSPDEEARARQASKTRFGEVTQISRSRRLPNGQSELIAELT